MVGFTSFWITLPFRDKSLRFFPAKNVHKRMPEDFHVEFRTFLEGPWAPVKQFLLSGFGCRKLGLGLILWSSTFGRVEIHNLHPKKVHTLQAWVMHDIGGVRSDSCSSSSIRDLKSIISERNITFTCQNNYRPVRFLQCVKNPEHPSCTSGIWANRMVVSDLWALAVYINVHDSVDTLVENKGLEGILCHSVNTRDGSLFP